jgi:hypothetical protein
VVWLKCETAERMECNQVCWCEDSSFLCVKSVDLEF